MPNRYMTCHTERKVSDYMVFCVVQKTKVQYSMNDNVSRTHAVKGSDISQAPHIFKPKSINAFECPICYTRQTHHFVMLECTHSLCLKCLETCLTYRHRKCVLCRHPIRFLLKNNHIQHYGG